MAMRSTRGTQFSNGPYAPRGARLYHAIRYSLFTVMGLAITAALYSAFWFYSANQLRNSIAGWIDTQRAAGLTATYEKLETGGFPFAMIVNVEGIKIIAPDGGNLPVLWGWQGEKLTARIRPWNLKRLVVEVEGEQELFLPGALRGLLFKGALGRLTTSVLFGHDGIPDEVDMVVAGLDLATPDGRVKLSTADTRLGAKRLFPSDDIDGNTTLTLDVDSKDVILPQNLRLPLGSDLGRVRLRARLLGKLPVDGGLADLVRWRDKGGTIELDTLETRYGPLTLRANGTVSLDAGMQPVAALTAKIEGFFQAVDALRAGRLIRSRDAAMAKIILGALSRRSPSGGAPSISLPLTIQERTFFAGPVNLFKLPEIVWRGAPDPTSGFRIIR